ncbi:hypothetical protein M1L60_28415 [Actinoplanes sp. TRM 88003]|uniref:DUF2442 domain-containing protein n=1 Tax=Paractinoplanes aksuensis TaxID=2939490 RepID=A0ABT1DUK7_9ACTN|nr:hypothetical protein [Actinoplanes aksuensis]MCO8274529.1 hypothetical protein [Actinoplanes aksuensis]
MAHTVVPEFLRDGHPIHLGFVEVSQAVWIHHRAIGGQQASARAVREVEASDSLGVRWPRNKRSDDATLILALDVE